MFTGTKREPVTALLANDNLITCTLANISTEWKNSLKAILLHQDVISATSYGRRIIVHCRVAITDSSFSIPYM